MQFEQLTADGDFVSDSQVTDAVSLATTLGTSPLEQKDAVYFPNDSGSVSYGIYGTVPGLLKKSDNGSFKFYGFPTYGGSTYCVVPMGLTAISSGSKHPQAAFDFLEYLYTYDAQRMVLSDRYFPFCDDVFEEYKTMMCDPDGIPSDDHMMIFLASELLELRGDKAVYRQIPDVFFDDLERAANSVNKVMYVDFAIFNILTDELNSYYLQGKEPKEIAVSLMSRLMLYIKENDL